MQERDRKTYKPMAAKVVSVLQENAQIRTFRLSFVSARDADSFRFSPGQFALFSVMGVGEATFSMSSDPSDKRMIEISVRKVGNTTNAMFGLRKGDRLWVRGPYGRGYPMELLKGRDLVIVAGGIGFPPLASVMEHVVSNRSDYGKVTLLYGVKDMGDVIYRERAERWAKESGVSVITTVEKKCSRWRGCVGLVTKSLEKMKVDGRRTAGLSCGPPIMLKYVTQDFLSMGILAESIYVSLERMMQCGMGKCGHCNIGDKYVCRDGPVFSYDELKSMKEKVFG